VFNALFVNKVDPKKYFSNFDSIQICLSKGLGGPAGALLFGSEEFLQKAIGLKKALGGSMRQGMGIIASCLMHRCDLDIIYSILQLDHQNAAVLRETLSKCTHVEVSLKDRSTNMVFLTVKPSILNSKFISVWMITNQKNISKIYGLADMFRDIVFH